MLDREEKMLSSIIEKIVDALVSKRQIQPGDRDKVLQALMHKERYYTHLYSLIFPHLNVLHIKKY